MTALRIAAPPEDLVRPEVRALSAYSLDLSPCRHKLDQNEVPWPLPRWVREAAARSLLAADWARYPDFHADALREKLAEIHGWSTDGILVGNGSNELLATAVAAIAGPQRRVMTLQPTFSLYGTFSLLSGARLEAVGPRTDLRLPLDELETEIERDPRRPVVLCSPNNPTGEAVAPERVERMLERLEAPLLLDNAYGEFCRYDYRPLLARHRHLVLFRTFSKAWSLAGIRLGYLLADPMLVAELIKVKLPYNLGHAGIALGLAALDARAAVERRIRTLVARRRQWGETLAGFGAECFPSEANFVLSRWPRSEFLLLTGKMPDHGIRVRDVSEGPGLDRCLRVSVGGGESLRAVRRALGSLLQEAGSAGASAGIDPRSVTRGEREVPLGSSCSRGRE